jgi:hypothetical protein
MCAPSWPPPSSNAVCRRRPWARATTPPPPRRRSLNWRPTSWWFAPTPHRRMPFWPRSRPQRSPWSVVPGGTGCGGAGPPAVAAGSSRPGPGRSGARPAAAIGLDWLASSNAVGPPSSQRISSSTDCAQRNSIVVVACFRATTARPGRLAGRRGGRPPRSLDLVTLIHQRPAATPNSPRRHRKLAVASSSSGTKAEPLPHAPARRSPLPRALPAPSAGGEPAVNYGGHRAFIPQLDSRIGRDRARRAVDGRQGSTRVSMAARGTNWRGDVSSVRYDEQGSHPCVTT